MDGRGVRTGRRGFLAVAGGGAVATAGSVPAQARSTVDESLRTASGTVKAVVRLEPADVSRRQPREAVLAELRRHAARTQRRFAEMASELSGVTIGTGFWLTNAVVVSIDTDRFDPARLADIEGVSRVFRNDGSGRHATERRLSASKPAAAEADSASVASQTGDREYSYGLEMMNVPDAWERYGVRGAGVSVAVVDTGVDPSHPDIDLAEWAEFDADGERVDSEPHDPDGHGTAMSSLVAGGDASGTQIGVAPDAELLVAKHDEDGFLTSTTAAMEWAIESGADVISLSIEFGLYAAEMNDAIENAAAAGVTVVTTGTGLNLLSSPGDVPSSLIAGAVDENREPYNDGTGGEIRTERYWRGVDVPDDWPDRFTAPDVATAGVDVLGAVPASVVEDEYVRRSGYSNGPPHLAGVVALLQSATDEHLGPWDCKRILRETASQPGAPFAEPDPNGRYGSGIADAARAVATLVEPDGEATGTVIDPDGEPIAGATVRFETGASTTTGADGTYRLPVTGGEGEITAEAVGYEPISQPVEVGENGNVAFQTAIRPEIERGERLPSYVEPGGSVRLRFDVAHADAVVVDRREIEHSVGDGISLAIEGDPAGFGDRVDVSGASSIAVDVDAADDAIGLLAFGVTVERRTDGGTDASTVVPDPIHVHPSPFRVEPGMGLQRAVDVAVPDTRIELTGGAYDVELSTFDRTFPATRTTTFEPVFAQVLDDPVGLVVDEPMTIAAADDAEPRITVRGDADGGIGVRIVANYVTLDGIDIDGNGVGTALNVVDGSAVHLDGLTIAGGDTGVHSQFNASLAVRDCAIEATDTGVLLTDASQNTLVSDNTITGAERGVFADSRNTPLDVSADVEGNGFETVGTDVSASGIVEISGYDVGAKLPGDSSIDLLLYALTAGSLGLLFVPYAFRRRG